MRYYARLLLGCILLNYTFVAQAQSLVANIDAGKVKSKMCATCHAEDGNAANPVWPKLAGQNAQYLSKELFDFRLGAKDGREDPVMTPVAQKLTDQDILDLAAYYQSLSCHIGTTDPKTLSLGQKLYRGGDLAKGIPACSACHSPNGYGNAPAAFPALSGQHADYVIAQLQAFKSGKRRNDLNHMMRDIAAKMSDEEMTAVANYVQGLH